MVSLYKPNKKNSGAACSFSWSDKDKAVYISMIKQHSWNEKTRNGSFKENVNNPKAKLFIKLSLAEVSGIINCTERRTEFSGYHSSNQIVRFSLKPGFTEGKVFRGLSFSVTRETKEDSTNKTSINVGFSPDDLVLIREFLRFCLAKYFTISHKENLEKIASRSDNGSNSYGGNSKNEDPPEEKETEASEDGEEIW